MESAPAAANGPRGAPGGLARAAPNGRTVARARAQAAPGPLAKEAKAAAPKSALTLYHLPESADHRGTGRQPGARHKGDHHHGRRDRMMHGENDGVHVRYSVLESEFGVRALSQGRSTTGFADCSPLR